jgi:predicted Zn-dependent protease
VDPAVPASWAAAVDQAIANWNNIGCGITMTRTSSTTDATTFVTMYTNTSTTTIATSNYPDMYGGAGRRININSFYNTLADAQKVFTATHELGHTIGFTHSNGTYGTLISGTTDADGSSIMNSSALNWVSFTSYDVTAAKATYPK